jgi:hypothetical protein
MYFRGGGTHEPESAVLSARMMVRIIHVTNPQCNEGSKVQYVTDILHINKILNFSEAIVEDNKMKTLNWIQMIFNPRFSAYESECYTSIIKLLIETIIL